MRLAIVLTAAALLAGAAPAAAQPPGANDFSCKSAAHPVPVPAITADQLSKLLAT